MADRNYLGHWATATAGDAAVNGLTLVGGKALTRTATPVLGSAGKALSVMPHPVARIAGKALTAGSKLGPLLADWGSFGIKAAPVFAALDTYGQYRADKDEAKWYKDHPYTYISATNPNINYGAATAAGLAGLIGIDNLPIFIQNKILKTLFKTLAAGGLGYAGYKLADKWQRSQTKQASYTEGCFMDINIVYNSMIKRAGLFDNFGAKRDAYNQAKIEASPGYMFGKWVQGKFGPKPQAQKIDSTQNSMPQAHYDNRIQEAQPQAQQPVQQPAGNALPQDSQQSANPVAQQNEALISSFNKMMNTINSANKTVTPQQPPQVTAATTQQQTATAPAATKRQPNYMDAVGFNNQK